MGTVNLGKVRDRVTGVERINGNGEAGTIDTYRVSFESSNYYDFNVTNGRNGVGQIVSFSGDSNSRNDLIVRIVNNQDKVLALLVKSSEQNDGYMQASFKVEKTAESTEGLVTTSTYVVIAYDPIGSQLFHATCKLSNLDKVPPVVTFTFPSSTSYPSGFEACLNAWCILYYDDSSTGITVDDELSDNSTNPVQNKAVTAALGAKLALPTIAPATRKVVTIDTNGAQDNVDGTELTTLMSNIVDSDGHKRFVDLKLHNDYRQDMINPEWVSYSKLVLNGNSLRAVVVIDIPSGETLADNTYCLVSGMNDQVENMNWLFDKIVAGQYAKVASVKLFDDDGNPYSNYFWFTKGLLTQGNALQIRTLGNYTNNTANVVTMRVEFNLIID